jgi:type IV secretory pathway VirB2 component (pilin)
MHVKVDTPLTPAEIEARFAGVARQPAARVLRYDTSRTPPKFFLSALPVTMPAAAESALYAGNEGTEVVLRLMWGPMPAPFPRVVAALGVILACGILAFSSRTAADWMFALVIAGLPLALLAYQREGERVLQERLATVLGSAPFVPKPH